MGRSNHSSIVTAAKRVERALQSAEAVHLPASLPTTTMQELVDQLRRAIYDKAAA